MSANTGPDLLSLTPIKTGPVTASEVRAALRRRFGAPEWALLFEVGDATGARHTRFADAVAMSLWPSRGLELHGIEIKVSKYDWRSEKANPQKAETIAAYCDRWFLVTGPGVVDSADEIPPAWGWMLFDGTKLVTVKEATRTEAKICDRKFLAALLRRASNTDDALVEAEIAKRMAAKEADFDQRVAREVDMRVRDRDRALKDIEAFEAASGIKIAEFRGWASDAEEIGRAVAAIQKSGVDKTYQGLRHAAEIYRDCAGKIEAAFAELGLTPRDTLAETTATLKRAARGKR